MAQQRARALRRLDQHNRARRLLPTAIVSSVVLVVAGFADRFVQSAVRQSAAIPSPTASTATATANARTLTGLANLLAQDRQAIAQLASAQSALARSAEGGEGSAASSTPAIALPSLPALPSIPSVALPAATTAPSTHATTGASVVVP